MSDSDTMNRVIAEVVVDHLDEADAAGLVAFRAVPATLVEPASVDGEQADWMLEASDALDDLPTFDQLASDIPSLLTQGQLCVDDPTSLASNIAACSELYVATGQVFGEVCGAGIVDQERVQGALDALAALASYAASDNPHLYDGVCTMVDNHGTAVLPAMDEAYAWLGQGTADRGARLVLVSDLASGEGADALAESALGAAKRFVGTTVFGGMGPTSQAEGDAIGGVPGALHLRTDEPGVALGLLDARFDQLLEPVAWGLWVTSASEHWQVARVFGADSTFGAMTVFPSQDHGALLVDFEALTEDAASHAPEMRVRWWTPAGAQDHTVPLGFPLGAVTAGAVSGDDLGALRLLAWRDVYDAQTGAADAYWVAEAVGELGETLEDPTLVAAAERL